jgi:alkylation response protein AidB-like acyl-CoA dehydrogenase
VNFAFSAEQEEFREAVRRFARERWPVAASRRLADDPRGFDPAVWRTMTRELGLAGLLVPESAGGQGCSMLELGIALEELGAELAGGPLFASGCLGALALLAVADEGERKELLPDLASGEAIAALAHREGVRAVSDRLEGTQRLVLDAQNATLLLVRADDDSGAGVYAVEAGATGLAIEPVASLDLTRRFAHVHCERVRARRLGHGDARPALARVALQASVALCAEQVGGARACLERAVDYMRERIQFGRPIGSFQALKHRAADAYGALELARSAAYWAWWVVAEDRPELAEAAHVAASLAAEAYDRAAREFIHLHGGMGFTWEHDAHLYLRRARTSQTLFGDPLAHRAALAAALGITVR